MKANQNVVQTNKNLEEASTQQKKSRKKYIIFLLIIVVAVAVVAGIVLFFTAWSEIDGDGWMNKYVYLPKFKWIFILQI